MTTKKLCFDDPIHYPGLTVHQPYAGLIRLAGMGFLGKDLRSGPDAFTTAVP